jgi:3-oxoacyl-[acyl-carrier-protein] synthase III
MWNDAQRRINGSEGSEKKPSSSCEVSTMFQFRENHDDGSSGFAVDEEAEADRNIAETRHPALRVKIASTSFYAPPRVETAAALAPRIGKSEDWIVTRTGVRERRIAEEPVEVIGARAARAALQSGPEPDLIVNASTTPRQLIPDTSVFIQDQLGFEGIPSFTVHATCLSFLVALYNAAALVAAGAYRRVLVVSAERPSPNRNMAEPESAALVGDGAAAAVLEPTPKDEASALLGWRMATWPKGAELTEVRGYGQRRDPNAPTTRPEDQLFSMDGPGVFKMARRRVVGLVRDLLADQGLRVEDVDWVVPHQASGPGLALLPRMGFAVERIVNIIGQYGNCVAASIPMALAHLAASGRLRRGQRVLLLGTGAGLSVAGALLRW